MWEGDVIVYTYVCTRTCLYVEKKSGGVEQKNLRSDDSVLLYLDNTWSMTRENLIEIKNFSLNNLM